MPLDLILACPVSANGLPWFGEEHRLQSYIYTYLQFGCGFGDADMVHGYILLREGQFLTVKRQLQIDM